MEVFIDIRGPVLKINQADAHKSGYNLRLILPLDALGAKDA
jgi:hypothetical protein